MTGWLQVSLVRDVDVVLGLLSSPVAAHQPRHVGRALVLLAEPLSHSRLATFDWWCRLLGPKELASWADVLVTHRASPQQRCTFRSCPRCFSGSVCPARVLSTEQGAGARTTWCCQILLTCPTWSGGWSIELELFGADPRFLLLRRSPLVPRGELAVGERALQ